MTVTLKPHQVKAVSEMKNGCIVLGGVGVGKTHTAMAYYMEREAPRDIYVITTAMKRDSLDWETTAAKHGVGKAKDATVAGVLTVDSWNNIVNYTDVKDAFFVFDEQRLVGAGAWVKAFLKIAKQNHWIMLSATPGDAWMDYAPVFIAHGFYKNRTEFIHNHVVYNRMVKFPKIDRYVETGKLERYRRSILVEMPYERHTKRHVKQILVAYNQELFDTVVKKRWNPYTDEPIKDIAQMFSLMRKVVNSDVSRLGATMEILEKHPRLIIFYNFDYELEMLRVLMNTLGYSYAEWNGHKHQDIPVGEKWVYLVQYTAGAEAWNCTTTDALLYWSLNYSYKINEQSRGRIDRINTPFTDLYYYLLRSPSPIDGAIIKSLASKKDFNERAFAKKWAESW